MKDLKNRVVVITGASSGIGYATALAFAAQESRIAVCARRADRLQELTTQIQNKGGEILAIRCDVSVKEDVDRFVSEVLSRWARIDVLICNAGHGYIARVDEITPEGMQQIFMVNVLGTLYAIQAALPAMKQKKEGSIVIVTSVVGRYALPLGGAYSATKFAQVALAQSLRAELKSYGIGVTAVYPGFTNTEFAEAAVNPGNRKTKRIGGSQPAEEVARAIVKAVQKNKREVYPNRLGSIFAHAGAISPSFLDRIMGMVTKRMGRA
jgi:short-subunit dehydrogenase